MENHENFYQHSMQDNSMAEFLKSLKYEMYILVNKKTNFLIFIIKEFCISDYCVIIFPRVKNGILYSAVFCKTKYCTQNMKFVFG